MKLAFELRRSHLKVFSAVCSNLVVVWLIAIFTTKDLFVIIRDIIVAVLAWYSTVAAEEVLEKHES
ncbi:MAG: hypothetical protein AAB600_04265 [Patescibacteria group bacterium]